MKIPHIVHRADLPALGIDDAERRRLLRAGRMTRAGVWYVTVDVPADLVSLLAEGVRPSCVTAAEHHGLWVPLHEGVHVYRPRGLGTAGTAPGRADPSARRSTSASGIPILDPGLVPPAPVLSAHVPGPTGTGSGLVEHGSKMRSWPDRDPIADLPLALAHAARCLPVRDTAILLESALNLRKMTMAAVRRLLASLPCALRAQFARVSPMAESGTETAVRWWLESLHVPVTPQVSIPGVGRVDLKLGTSWIIECDSASFHDDPAQYHRDRARDLRLQARRYMVTRLTWEQVFLDWEATSTQLLTILRRRDHRRPLAG